MEACVAALVDGIEGDALVFILYRIESILYRITEEYIMREVGIFEARTQLSQLVQAVEAGEDVVLTRHGKPVARLVSAIGVSPPWSAARWANELRDFRHGRDRGPVAGATVAELIAAGRARHG